MLKLVDLNKSFSSHIALRNICLEIPQGEFFSLLGPSGCGKTTLLRILAGLETLSSGEIYIEKRRVDLLPPQARPFNMVFQKYALFPHMSVFDNVAFGLKLKKVPTDEIQGRVKRVLELVNMSEYGIRSPETLSGGQQQRVAVARALVNEPKVLLLDEPLSALDQKLREHMQRELRALQKQLGLTFIYVTHDQEEAFALSDRIALMNAGQVEQVSTAAELYENPKTPFVAEFIGQNCRWPGELVERDSSWVQAKVGHGLMVKGLARNSSCQTRGNPVQIYIRPEKVEMVQGSPTSVNHYRGRLIHKTYKGGFCELQVEVESGCILRILQPAVQFRQSLGAEIHIQFQPEDTYIFGTSS